MLGRNFHYHAVVHQAHAHGRVYAVYVCIAHSSDFYFTSFCAQVSLLFHFFSFLFFAFTSFRMRAHLELYFGFNYWHFYYWLRIGVCNRTNFRFVLSEMLNFWHLWFFWELDIASNFVSNLVLSVIACTYFLCTRKHFNCELATIRFVNLLESAVGKGR